ncbi:MAG: hypothetical protein ACD_79C00496G0006 [uncultured bacterium]|nr:MAG: hypothetical protein ACD_79C00496G0006 [uncultured bacterium]
MKNMEQIRAQNAWNVNENIGGKQGGEVVKKLPALIRTNGILCTIAYCIEQKGEEDNGYKKIMDIIAKHLSHPEIGRCKGINNGKELLNYLTSKDSQTLRAVTSETQAFLNYLRRFVKKGAAK